MRVQVDVAVRWPYATAAHFSLRRWRREQRRRITGKPWENHAKNSHAFYQREQFFYFCICAAVFSAQDPDAAEINRAGFHKESPATIRCISQSASSSGESRSRKPPRVPNGEEGTIRPNEAKGNDLRILHNTICCYHLLSDDEKKANYANEELNGLLYCGNSIDRADKTIELPQYTVACILPLCDGQMLTQK
ncbi:hypothetical protein CEXT_776221 [Caerostris extrusa]|uniref:Uncharacterized protein n=1 Tax=Caerostris extrusa TaxID=172846 RepID=A0AAV4N050_CAEEX|nr:hypothetical protein CEXT_776221 [Caerostris extrusa]